MQGVLLRNFEFAYTPQILKKGLFPFLFVCVCVVGGVGVGGGGVSDPCAGLSYEVPLWNIEMRCASI